MASEGKPTNSNNNNRVGHDDETAGILWERSAGYPPSMRKMETITLSERSPASAERLPGFLQTVGLTVLVCFLLVTGNHYYHEANASVNANANANANAGLVFEGSNNSNNAGAAFENSSNNEGTVLVTGATGRLGALLYKELQKKGATVRAFVRDAEKARTVLGCSVCDETEGIYVGDITNPDDLQHAMADGSVTTLAVAIGAGYKDPPEVVKAVEFDSVVSSVRALGLLARMGGGDGHSNNNNNNLRVVFCSSMGTEQSPPPKWGGPILHWKLNAETFLATSGISTTIVKPCGLPADMAGKNSTLLVGHFGAITEGSDYHSISREDVASVMTEAAMGLSRHNCQNLRFDLCSKPGPTTTDLEALIENARWEWDQPN